MDHGLGLTSEHVQGASLPALRRIQSALIVRTGLGVYLTEHDLDSFNMIEHFLLLYDIN